MLIKESFKCINFPPSQFSILMTSMFPVFCRVVTISMQQYIQINISRLMYVVVIFSFLQSSTQQKLHKYYPATASVRSGSQQLWELRNPGWEHWSQNCFL